MHNNNKYELRTINNNRQEEEENGILTRYIRAKQYENTKINGLRTNTSYGEARTRTRRKAKRTTTKWAKRQARQTAKTANDNGDSDSDAGANVNVNVDVDSTLGGQIIEATTVGPTVRSADSQQQQLMSPITQCHARDVLVTDTCRHFTDRGDLRSIMID